jgi:hypothetical protein
MFLIFLTVSGFLFLFERKDAAQKRQPRALLVQLLATVLTQQHRLSTMTTTNTDLSKLAYFHANLNRETAETMLRALARPGLWLLRPSRGASVIALSQIGNDFTCSHARIFLHPPRQDANNVWIPGGFSVESDNQVFQTIEELITRLRFTVANSMPVTRSPSPIANAELQQQRVSSVRSPRQLPPTPSVAATSTSSSSVAATTSMSMRAPTPTSVSMRAPTPPSAVSSTGSLPMSVGSPVPQESMLINVSELQFGRELGDGSFGTVYEGLFRGMTIAIKVPKQSADVEEQEAFEAEARIMASIPMHPNVVRCFGFTSKPNLFVALQICRNGSLYDLLQSEHNISGAWMLRVLRDIAAGMQHLHACHIVHRDLAARNVLLDENYRALIADFGMSRREKGGAHRTANDTGPLKWLAPESIRSRLSSEASDMWSFGVLITEVMTRNEPYPELEPVQVAVKVAYEGLVPSRPKGCTPTIASILQSASQFDPAQRPTFAYVGRWLSTQHSVLANENFPPQQQQQHQQQHQQR